MLTYIIKIDETQRAILENALRIATPPEARDSEARLLFDMIAQLPDVARCEPRLHHDFTA